MVDAQAGPTAVRDGDDLQAVSVRVHPVQSSATVVAVDLSRTTTERVGEVGDAALDEPAQDRVELLLPHQKGVVLPRRGPVVVGDVQGHVVAEHDHGERPEGRVVGRTQDGRVVTGRCALVVRPDDRVVQRDRHGVLLGLTGDGHGPHPDLNSATTFAIVAGSVTLIGAPEAGRLSSTQHARHESSVIRVRHGTDAHPGTLSPGRKREPLIRSH
jgi:hypothetical protein